MIWVLFGALLILSLISVALCLLLASEVKALSEQLPAVSQQVANSELAVSRKLEVSKQEMSDQLGRLGRALFEPKQEPV